MFRSKKTETRLETKPEAVAKWLRLRKKSVIAHWLFGAFLAGLAYLSFPAALALFGFFSAGEYWEDKSNKTHDGVIDCWDVFLVLCIGLTILSILQVCSIIPIRWY